MIAVKRALMKVNARTGSIERLCTLPDAAPPEPFVTGSWGEDGTILFSIGGPTGLYRTDASGTTPQVATTLDTKRGDNYHSWPQLLPGRRFLFFVHRRRADEWHLRRAARFDREHADPGEQRPRRRCRTAI